MKRLNSVAASLMLICAVTAYADGMRPLSTEYDFGVWSESQGKRTGEVKFINEGEEASFIARVRPSCGCTGADFTKEPVMPGDTARVSFTYDPAGRPGQFEKTVKVYTGEDQKLSVITIRGTIIGRPESLERDYPIETGAVRLASSRVDFGRVPPDRLRHDFIRAYNQTGDTIRTKIMDTPPQLEITVSSPEIPPGHYFSIGICLDTSKEPAPGYHEYSFDISDGNSDSPSIPITVSTEILTPADSLTPEQLADAPRLTLDPTEMTLKLRSKGSTPFRFKITNTGRSILTVRDISSPDKNVKMEKWPVHLDPGASGWAQGRISATSAGHCILKIHTSDPMRPEVEMRVAFTR